MLKNGRVWILQIIFICFLIAPLFSPAGATVTPKTNNHHFEIVQKRLIKDGFDPDKIQRLYSRPQINFEADGVSVFFTYSEAKVDYDQFANDWSIRKAKKYMQTHGEDLKRTQEAFGVDSQVITAILLVETGLGSTVGTRSTLNTLSTMASLMDPQVRSSFWEMSLKSKNFGK
jgi:membrane-bound lytic murein transglycosylase B